MTEPTNPPPRPRNVDRVAKPVALWSLAGLALAALGQALLDGVIDPAEQQNLLSEAAQLALAGIPVLLGWLAARRARENVTPILPGDQPRNRRGEELHPRDHGPAGGYPRGVGLEEYRAQEGYRGEHERDDT